MANPETGISLRTIESKHVGHNVRPFGQEGHAPEHAALNPKDFRKRGELEEVYGLKPLPKTKISYKAQKKLEGWGLDLPKIKAVQELTASFRYDIVSEKVKRLAKESINVYRIGERERVDLSALLDKDGRRLDGQCLDIAAQWGTQSHKSKLIEELNRNLEEGNRIAPMFYVGLSETHFNKYLDTHCWNGLALVGPDGNVKEEIYIDAAFQTIHTKEESAYKEEKADLDPKNIKTEKEYTVQIGSAYVNKDNFISSTLETVILGASSDHKYVYGLGFARDHKTNAIRPVLERTYPDGSHDDYIIYNGQILTACRTEDSDEDSDQSAEHSGQNIEEAEGILKIAAGFKFVETSEPPKRRICNLDETRP